MPRSAQGFIEVSAQRGNGGDYHHGRSSWALLLGSHWIRGKIQNVGAFIVNVTDKWRTCLPLRRRDMEKVKCWNRNLGLAPGDCSVAVIIIGYLSRNTSARSVDRGWDACRLLARLMASSSCSFRQVWRHEFGALCAFCSNLVRASKSSYRHIMVWTAKSTGIGLIRTALLCQSGWFGSLFPSGIRRRLQIGYHGHHCLGTVHASVLSVCCSRPVCC